SVSKTRERGFLPSTLNACLTRSSRPNQTVLGWVCLSVARSLSHTEVGCQFLPSIRTAQYFKSCYLPPTEFHESLAGIGGLCPRFGPQHCRPRPIARLLSSQGQTS